LDDLRSLIRRVSDDFAYVVCYCPGFPEEDRETLDSAFRALVTGVEAVFERTKNPDATHWLRLSLRDLNAALAAYRLGDNLEGERLLESGRGYFEDSVKGKPIRGQVDYFVDSEGNTRSP